MAPLGQSVAKFADELDAMFAATVGSEGVPAR